MSMDMVMRNTDTHAHTAHLRTRERGERGVVAEGRTCRSCLGSQGMGRYHPVAPIAFAATSAAGDGGVSSIALDGIGRTLASGTPHPLRRTQS
jgi:hypothetical protein